MTLENFPRGGKKSEIKRSIDQTHVDKFMELAGRLRIPELGFSWDDKTKLAVFSNAETSSDDEQELKEDLKQKKKKLNATERREQERQEEREIRQREEALMSNRAPNSIDQFDRLILSSPDSSLVWLQYMAHHLQATEIDKARAVAKRAIKTINFREENERLNVWNAWLNLESRYGNVEFLNDVFREAVRTNDAYKVYMHMLTIHADAGRKIELEKLIDTVISKFKQDPQTWIDCGAALLKIGMKEKSRQIMQRALQSLPVSQHVNLLVRFANLENKLGDKERAQTLFENILSSYPKRIDVWSCYIDCLIKSNDIDLARKVLEQACVQTLSPRKMKILFMKFINFEEKYGTSEAVNRVRQMATDYMEKHK
ncbi:PREDICTED: protein RRP5 homolog isoform X1 [Cyphomyrmex costatus]|nr:PREDICTED: protein RRP5 homolog isoform X1 [Cyphomyrmex costatus]